MAGEDHGGAEALLERARPNVPRRLPGRELRIEALVAGLLVAVAVAMAVLVPSSRSLSLPELALHFALYFAACRVRVYTGAGAVLPTQLAFVPMLFALPLGIVPLVCAAALAASALLDVALRREHVERVVTAVGDAWYTVAPVAVLAIAGSEAWPVFALAFAAQCVFDVVASTVREWAGRSILPGLQLRVMASVYAVDALLTPVALLVAVAAEDHPLAPLVCAPLLVLLAVFARDRRLRIDRAIARLDELERERERLQDAIRRVGEAFATQIDARALLACVVDTAVDALQATRGRARAGEVVESRGWDTPDDELAAAVGAAEDAALAGASPPGVVQGSAWAVARPVRAGEDGPVLGVLSLGRPERPFSPEEQDLLGYLAGQAAISVQNALLHEELRRQATVDELTGLSNHRRLQQALDEELERSRRFPAPLSLLILDIDDFKKVNDTYGHLQGDMVLRAVAGAVRTHCRSVDEAARYGGEELAVMLRGTDRDGAYRAAESIRRAIEALEIPLDEPGRTLRVTASVGVAELDRDEMRKNDLIAAADGALYEAKRAGKNRTVAAAPPVQARS